MGSLKGSALSNHVKNTSSIAFIPCCDKVKGMHDKSL